MPSKYLHQFYEILMMNGTIRFIARNLPLTCFPACIQFTDLIRITNIRRTVIYADRIVKFLAFNVKKINWTSWIEHINDVAHFLKGRKNSWKLIFSSDSDDESKEFLFPTLPVFRFAFAEDKSIHFAYNSILAKTWSFIFWTDYSKCRHSKRNS